MFCSVTNILVEFWCFLCVCNIFWANGNTASATLVLQIHTHIIVLFNYVAIICTRFLSVFVMHVYLEIHNIIITRLFMSSEL